MARPADALKREVIPAWNRFIGEVLPAGQTSHAARAVNDAYDETDSALSSSASALRRIANGRIYPNAEAVWLAAEAARHIPARSWCAGPLLLFAAGRFELFAVTMLGAPFEMVSSERKGQLLASVVEAVEPSVNDLHFEPIRRKLIENGADELSITRHLKKFLRRPKDAVTGARAVWSLTAMEESAFALAWERRGALRPTAPTVAARLAEANPDVGLLIQREIVLGALRDALRRGDRQ